MENVSPEKTQDINRTFGKRRQTS